MAARLETSSLLAPQTSVSASQPLINSSILVHSVSRTNREDYTSESSCCGHQYRIQCVKSKGAIIVLLWTLLLHFAIPFDTSVHLLQLSLDGFTKTHRNLFDSVFQSRALYRALFILYPLMGWIADAKIGRYRAIVASIISIFIASVLMVVGYLIHIYAHKSIALQIVVTILLGLGVLFNVSGFACFDANAIPFLTDQLLGASGENLSALIHWHFWFSAVSEIFNVSISISSIVLGKQFLTLSILVIHFVCAFIILLSVYVCGRWLDTTITITNPIKLIFKVLRYASRHNYPENRSALTYWEETVPTRIDLGKEKYGGPFTEEEVEDVKTTFRLLPLVFLSTGYGIMLSQLTYVTHLRQPTFHNNATHIAMFLLEEGGFQNAFFMLLLIPLFHFFLYPFFYNRIPSVLKRVGFGLLLAVLHLAYITLLDIFAHHDTDSTSICLLNNASYHDNNVLSVKYYWGLPFVTLGALSELFVVPFVIEFIVAQTPGPMKGLMIGLWFGFYGIVQMLGIYTYFPFKEVPDSATPSCTFYYYLTKTLLSVVFFTVFSILAHRYKMRTRDLPINFNILAETHISKYLSITEDDRYVRDTSQFMESDTSSSCSSCDS